MQWSQTSQTHSPSPKQILHPATQPSPLYTVTLTWKMHADSKRKTLLLFQLLMWNGDPTFSFIFLWESDLTAIEWHVFMWQKAAIVNWALFVFTSVELCWILPKATDKLPPRIRDNGGDRCLMLSAHILTYIPYGLLSFCTVAIKRPCDSDYVSKPVR